MLDNKTLLTAVLIVLGISILGPSLTGNYGYRGASATFDDECGSPGESFCVNKGTIARPGTYQQCVYDAKQGRNVLSSVYSCQSGKICSTKYEVGFSRADCVYATQANF